MPAFSIPIEPVNELGGAVAFPVNYIVEESGQTAVAWTPVMLNGTDGGVQAWDGSSLTNAIAGFNMQNFANLATTGAGAPNGITGVLGPGSVIGSYPANPNEPLAVILPPGVPISDGFMYFVPAINEVVFVGVLGNAGVAIATANSYVGKSYGLTKDPVNAYWYVDISKTGASAAVRIKQLDPRDAVGTVGGRVWFTVLAAASAFQS
jgi:hypothetical protein